MNRYKTHALGKWDVGFMKKECSPTFRGFDTFFGYYTACEADYWYHAAPVRYSTANFTTCSPTCCDNSISDQPTDFSNSSGADIRRAGNALNGTYNTRALADEAARIISVHNTSRPLYMYLAFMAVHDGCAEPTGIPDLYKLGNALAFGVTHSLATSPDFSLIIAVIM